MTRPLPAWRVWFNNHAAISCLPEDCIADCSAPGKDATEACNYWIERLNFEAPPWLLREHLKEYGAWSKAELCDHQANLRRLLWTWACDCRENEDPNYLPFLGV